MPPRKKEETPAEQSVEQPAKAARPYMSEGVRQDLAAYGEAGDPATGGRFKRDEETGRVTYTDRAGKVTAL